MCRKLIQVYACGHNKVICTTACQHALDTGQRLTRNDGENVVTRSNSTLLPMAASSTSRGLTSAQSRSTPASPVSFESLQAHQSRSLISSQPSPVQSSSNQLQPVPISPAPSYHSSTTPAPAPAPAPSTTPSLAHLPGHAKAAETEPNYCAYYFPHNLPQSNHPCVDCFVLPEWEHRAKRWMMWYRADHLGENPGDVERLSGVAALREKKAREGLLNVFVHGDESAGRIV